MPQHKPLDTPATLLSPHAPSPEISVLLSSQGISSDSPGCSDPFCTPCLPKQHTVYCPGFWGLHSPKTNSQRRWRPEDSSTTTPWVVLDFLAGTESCWKSHSWPLKRVILRCFTIPCSMSSRYTQTPVEPLSYDKIKVVTELMAGPSNVYNKHSSAFVTAKH